jgi:hypothetical protein
MNAALENKMKSTSRLNYLFLDHWNKVIVPMLQAGRTCFFGSTPIGGEQGPTSERSLLSEGIPYKYYDYSISQGKWIVKAEGRAVGFTGRGCNRGAFIINEDGSLWQYDDYYYGNPGFFGHSGGIRLEIGGKVFGCVGNKDTNVDTMCEGMGGILPKLDQMTFEIFFTKQYSDAFAREHAA